MVGRMTEDLEPVAADGPKPESDWRTQYDSTPDPAPRLTRSRRFLRRPAAPSDAVETRPLWLAFLAAAVAALLSGLLWAGIAIATGYNLGILALFIGAVTGLTAQRVAGAGIGGFERGLAGLFAAVAIVLGNYVIGIHELKAALPGDSIGYFKHEEISLFLNHFGAFVHGMDWLWLAIAAYAAIRTAGGQVVLGMGRPRS